MSLLHRHLWTLAIILLVIVETRMTAQVLVLQEMPITISGSVNAGYTGGRGGTSTTNSMYLGTNSYIDGYYHDPRLLKFNVAPNVLWDRNGATNNPAIQDNGEGVTSNVQFLGGSSMPISFSHSFYRTNTATLAGGGVPFTVAATGTSNDMSLGVSYTRGQRIPAVSLNYSRGSSTSSIDALGAQDVTNTHSGLSTMANYQIVGFHLFGSYAQTHRNQHTPDVLQLGNLTGGKTNMTTESAGFTRALPRKTFVDARWARNGTETTQFGEPLNQRYDTANANLTTSPIKPLLLSFGSNYSSNTAAQLYSQIINGDTTPTLTVGVISFGARSLSYNGGATYNIGHGFFALGSAGHEADTLLTRDTVDVNVSNGGLMYGRNLFHGVFNGFYNIGANQVTSRVSGIQSSQSAMTQAGTASYSRKAGRWMNQASFRFTSNGSDSSDIPIRIVSQSYSGDLNTTTKLFYRLVCSAGFSLNESHTTPLGSSNSSDKSFYGSLSNRSWSVTGREQISSGYALYTGAGITPVYLPGGAATLLSETHRSSSKGTSVAVAFRRRRLQVVSMYSNSNVDLTGPTGPVVASNSNFDTKLYYKIRKLDFRVGFRKWSQSASSNNSLNISSQTYFVEVIRQFRLF